MINKICFFVFFIVSLTVKAETFEVDVNLADICGVQVTTEQAISSCQAPDGNPLDEKSIPEVISRISPKVSLDLSTTKEETCQMLAENNNSLSVKQTDDSGNNWIFNLSFGYTRTKYFNSDVHFQSSRMDVVVKDFDWKERTSFNYFHKENLKGVDNMFRFIDEPTNAAFLSAKKGKNVFVVSMLHHKYLKQVGQVRHVSGTIDGVDVDRNMLVNQIDDYKNDPHDPGAMYLGRFENTWIQTTVQVGYGREFNLLKNKNFQINYTPTINVGIMSGKTYSAYQSKEDYWTNDTNQDNWRIHGITFSQGNKIDFKYKRVGLFIDQKLIVTKVKNQFLDGTATYNFVYAPVTVGVTVDLNGKKVKKKG